MTIAGFKLVILPVLQSIVASLFYDVAKNGIFAKEVDVSLSFDESLKDAFCRAVVKVRNDDDCNLKTKYTQDEFKYYQKVIKDELIGLEPTERNIYVEKTLYKAFKEEVRKSPNAMHQFTFDLVIECRKHQAKIMKHILDLKTVSEKTLTNTENIKGYVAEIPQMSALLSEIAKQLGISVNGGISLTVVEDGKSLLLPHFCSPRTNIVSELSNLLREKRSILIQGSILSGKTVLSVLLSKEFPDYAIKFVPLNEKGFLCVKAIVEEVKLGDRIVLILDALKYDCNRYEELCRLIEHYKSESLLFVMNSYDRITDYFIDSPISEFSIPMLTPEETMEMLPEPQRKVWGSIIYAKCAGQPMLTQMVFLYLEKHGWNIDLDSLITVLTSPSDSNVTRKLRNSMGKMINEPGAYQLLNRLLLIPGSFSEKDCQKIAQITPAIPNSLQCFYTLQGVWVDDNGDGTFEVSGIVKRSLKPDLIDVEKRLCSRQLVENVLKNKSLTPIEVLQIINLYVGCELWEDAAAFYSFTMIKLLESELLQHKDFDVVRAIWMDVELPVDMLLTSKVSIRLIQCIVLNQMDKDASYATSDLLLLLDQLNDRSEHKSFAYFVLYSISLLEGQTDDALRYLNLSHHCPISLLPLSNISCESRWVLLNAITTVNQLEKWIDSYAKDGFPEWYLMHEAFFITVNHLKKEVAGDNTVNLLESILGLCRKYDGNLMSLEVVVCSALIDWYSDVHDLNKVRAIFDEHSSLLSYMLGKLLFNYAFGLALNNNGDHTAALSYIKEAAEVEDITMLCMTSLNARCYYAEMISKESPKKALDLIRLYVENSAFEKSLMDYEKMQAYGTYAYVLWMNGDRTASVAYMLKVQNYLYENRDKETDDYKMLLLRFSILVTQLNHVHKDGSMDDRFAKPSYRVFVQTVDNILDLYSSVKVFSVSLFLCELVDAYLDDPQEELTLIEQTVSLYKSKAQGYESFATILLYVIPFCLMNRRYDIVTFVVKSAGAGLMDFTEKKINSEKTVLLFTVYEILLHRISHIANKESFNDNWIFDLMEDYKQYIQDATISSKVKEQMLTDKPNFASLTDDLDQAIVYLYHIDNWDANNALNLMFRIYTIKNNLRSWRSSNQFVEMTIVTYGQYMINKYPFSFDGDVKDFNNIITKGRKIKQDFLVSIMQGYHYILKHPLKMTSNMENVIMP